MATPSTSVMCGCFLLPPSSLPTGPARQSFYSRRPRWSSSSSSPPETLTSTLRCRRHHRPARRWQPPRTACTAPDSTSIFPIAAALRNRFKQGFSDSSDRLSRTAPLLRSIIFVGRAAPGCRSGL
jgi:hypothetical protein